VRQAVMLYCYVLRCARCS